jgi:hypothetical protein
MVRRICRFGEDDQKQTGSEPFPAVEQSKKWRQGRMALAQAKGLRFSSFLRGTFQQPKGCSSRNPATALVAGTMSKKVPQNRVTSSPLAWSSGQHVIFPGDADEDPPSCR